MNMHMMKTVEQFVAGNGMRNQWIDVGPYTSLYLRRSIREFGDKVLDVATVSVDKQVRGQKIFTNILNKLERLAIKYDYDALYIENVLTHRFRKFFREKGWTEISDGFGGASFYKVLKDG